MANFTRPVAFEAFIGPRYVPSNASPAYGVWDYYSSLTVDNPGENLPFISHTEIATLNARVLDSTLGALSTTGLSVSNGGLTGTGSGWPTTGGVWVGPGSATQGWEYIEYINSGANLRRNPQRGVADTAHAAGAPVYWWYPLATNSGTLNISMEQSENMAVRQWTATLEGVRAPSQILKPDHYIAVTYDQLWDTENWQGIQNFNVLLFGLISKVSMSQDATRQGQWQIEISSMARVLQQTSIPGMRIGAFDIALEADVEASSSLGAAWKLTLPQKQQADADPTFEPDLVELQEDMGPDHVVDGNRNTLWVSDGWLGNPALFSNDVAYSGVPTKNAWASVFAFPPATHVMGSRYIEIISHDGLDFTWLWAYTKYEYPHVGSGNWRGFWIQISEPNMFQQQGIEVDSLPGAEDRVIIAEHAETFQKLFPAAQPKFLIDASTLSGKQDMEAGRRHWWQGGALMMAWSNPENSVGYLWHWGNVTYAELLNAWEPVSEGGLGQGTTDFDLPDSNYYLNIAAIKPGQVFRRNFAGPTTTIQTMEFTHDYIHHPGYVIHDRISDDVSEWIKLSLPEMQHFLRDDIDAGDTTIYVVDNQGNPNIEGLSKNSGGGGGVIMVDDEAILFTGKSYDNGTLTGATVGSVHKAGSRVYVRWLVPWYGVSNEHTTGGGAYPVAWRKPFQDKYFPLASAGFPLSKLKWGRGFYSDDVTPRMPFLGSFEWRISLYPDARSPSTEGHEIDYLSEININSESYTPSVTVPNATLDFSTAHFATYAADGFRPRTFLMQMRQMWNVLGTRITARPMLNYIEAEVDRNYFNPETWLDAPAAGLDNDLFVYYVILKSKIYLSAVSVYNPNFTVMPKRGKGMTDRGTAWQIASDAAEYGSSIIEVTLWGKIRVRPNDYLIEGTHPIERTFTSTDIASVEVVNIRPADIGQIRVEWESPHNQLAGIAAYPDDSEVPENMEITEIGPILAQSQADANIVAFNLYKTRRFARNVFVEFTHLHMEIQTGEIHNVVYDFDLTGEIIDNILMVESVEHQFSELSATTVVNYREVDKEIA